MGIHIGGTTPCHSRGWAHELSDVKVKGKHIRFAIEQPQFTLAFEGKRKGDGWEGKCKWKGLGTCPWTAEPMAAAKP